MIGAVIKLLFGKQINLSAKFSEFLDPSESVINIISPPLALISWIFDIVFLKYLSKGAKTITGTESSIKAKGPCFS